MIEFSVRQIAQALSTSEETVRRWIRDGQLLATSNSKKQGHKVTAENLCHFLDSNPKYRTENVQVLLDTGQTDSERFYSQVPVLRTDHQSMFGRSFAKLSPEFMSRYDSLHPKNSENVESEMLQLQMAELEEKIAIHQKYIEMYSQQLEMLRQKKNF